MDTALQHDTIALIRQGCRAAAGPLQRVAEVGVKAVHRFRFDIGGMRDFSEKIRKSVEHRADFQQLAAVRGPAVYVFEICPPGNSVNVLAAAKLYADTKTRAVPARRSNIDDTSSVLYVGKVSSVPLSMRVIQHLGFSRSAATQGLQLYHWARELSLILDMTVFEFEDDMAAPLPLVERAVARQLRPLLGKHE
jgi:hypothetical protein